MTRRLVPWIAVVAAAAACGDFESPEIVLDLRILGMTADPPEIVIDADDPDDVSLDDIPEVTVCALVADPADSRRLRYQMIACPPRSSLRCFEDTQPRVIMGDGEVDDPEQADQPVTVCQTLRPTGSLLAVIEESVRADDLAGFGGIGIQVGLSVEPEGAPDQVQFASKELRFAARIPDTRVANTNPAIERVMIAREATGPRHRGFAAPAGRCGDVDPFVVLAGEKVALLPVAGDGSVEDYVVPTFDGETREFTESLTYAWYSTEGSWGAGTTGGPPDPSGAIQDPDTTWTAPDDPEVVGDSLDVMMWFVQRDERGGASWVETCARVVP